MHRWLGFELGVHKPYRPRSPPVWDACWQGVQSHFPMLTTAKGRWWITEENKDGPSWCPGIWAPCTMTTAVTDCVTTPKKR